MTFVFTVSVLLVLSAKWACIYSTSASHRKRQEPVIPPPTKGELFPRLLHENDVIYSLDSEKRFKKVGHGAYADVYLGELRDTGSPIVIKSFRDSDFEEVMDEVQMHRYVEQMIRTPRFVGLLPAGPASGNVSIVYEYFPHSKVLVDWLDRKLAFTQAQWVQICLEMTKNLQRLHKIDVLHNDLHQGNILIQKPISKLPSAHGCYQRSDPITYILDFGAATYKHGKFFSSSYGSLKSYLFLAPELMRAIADTPREQNVESNAGSRKKNNADEYEPIRNEKDTMCFNRTLTNKIEQNYNHLQESKRGKGSSTALLNKNQDFNSSVRPEKTNQELNDQTIDQDANSNSESIASSSRATTSPASDIFSLGYLLEAVAARSNLTRLRRLSLWCQAQDPENRPQIHDVIGHMQEILVELRLIELSSDYHRNFCKSSVLNSIHLGHHPFLPLFSFDGNQSSPSSFPRPSLHSCSYEKKRYNVFSKPYKDSSVPMALIDHRNLLEDLEEPFVGHEWIRFSSNDAIRLGLLNSSKEVVIVKIFYNSDFSSIRHEACVTKIIARMGFAPRIIGMLFASEYLNESAFVQERFGEGVTLLQFIEATQMIEWDLVAIQQTVMGFNKEKGNSNTSNRGLLRDYFMNLCGMTFKTLHCKEKSHRQVRLEDILRRVAEMLDSIHQSKLLVNNLHAGNILLGLDRDDIDVKLIDLGKVASFEDVSELDSDDSNGDTSVFPYLAPELSNGGVFSIFTDIYSLCVLIFDTLRPYFPKYYIDLQDTHKTYLNTMHGELSEISFGDHSLSVSCCSNKTKCFKCFSPTSESKCCCVKNLQKNKNQKSKDIWKPNNFKTNADSNGFNGFNKLAELQRQLFRCLHDKPWKRPTIKELLQNL